MSSARSSRPTLVQALVGHPAGRALCCVLSGTLLFLSCADFDIWPLCWVGLFPFLLVLLTEEGMPRTRRPFLYGFLCGLLANGGGFYWIVGLLSRFGHLPFVAAAPIFLLLVAYQALTFGIFASVLCRLRAQVGVSVTWLAALCWTACELCVPYIFPWYLAITQAWVPPVIQIADITGPLGVSFLLVLCNGALFDTYCVFMRHRRTRERLSPRMLRAPIAAALTIVLSLGYGLVRIHQVHVARDHAPRIKVGVVQANIGIHEKFVAGLGEQQLLIHQRESAELERRGADLVVWPESSYPYYLLRPPLSDFPQGHPWMVRRGMSKPLLFGTLTLREHGTTRVPYNTAVMMDPGGRVTGFFDKNFLLVFGEYIPFAEQMQWLREMIPEISNFARGTTTTTFPFVHQGHTYDLGPMICYEDIIPAFGRRLFDTPTPPNLLINITNDAWFGATSEPYEHMALSVFRAVEHRVDLVRAVNTGVSAFIDATGRVYDKGPSVDPSLTPGVQPTTLLSEAALMTPGGLYQRLGEAFGGGCLVLVLLFGVLTRYRAGCPLRWLWLLCGAAGLHLMVVMGFLLPGASIKVLYAVLAHRNEGALSDAEVFRATWQLGLLLMSGSAILGAILGVLGLRDSRWTAVDPHGIPGRLEAIAAIISVTVLPVVLKGRMEGNTGSVVILTLLCVVAALLAGRVGRRLGGRSP